MLDLLDLREGARELRVSIHTLRAWTYQKKIPFVRLGRRIFLRREDIEAFVNQNLVQAKQ